MGSEDTVAYSGKDIPPHSLWELGSGNELINQAANWGQGCAYSSPQVRCSSSTHLCSCFATWLIRRRNFSVSSTLANLSVCLGFYFWLLEKEGAGFSLHTSTVSCPTGELHRLIVMLLVRAACLYQDTVFSACLRRYWQSQALSGGIKTSIYQELTTTIKGNGLGNSAPFNSPSNGTLIESSAGWDGAALLLSFQHVILKAVSNPLIPVCTCSILFQCSVCIVPTFFKKRSEIKT